MRRRYLSVGEARRAGRDGLGPTLVAYRLAWWERWLLYLLVVACVVGCIVGVVAGDAAWAVIIVGSSLFALWLWWVAHAHEGTLSTAGELWFANPVRQWRFHVEDVQRISIRRNEGSPVSFVIRSTSGTVRVSYRSGAHLVDSIVAANPDIDVRGYTPGRGTSVGPSEEPEHGRPTEPPPTTDDRYIRPPPKG